MERTGLAQGWVVERLSLTKGSWGYNGRGREGPEQGPRGSSGAVFMKGPGRRVVLIDSFFMHSFIKK